MNNHIIMTLLSAALVSLGAAAAPTIEDTPSSVTLSVGKTRLVFDKKQGVVSSLEFQGTEFVQDKNGFRPNFWRALDQTDIENRIPERSAKWKEFSAKPVVKEIRSWTEDDGAVYLGVEYDSGCKISYTLSENGALDVMLMLYPTEEFVDPVILDGPGMMYNPNQTEEERAAELAEFRAMQNAIRAQARLDWELNLPLIPRVGVCTDLPASFKCDTVKSGDGPDGLFVGKRKGRGVVIQTKDATFEVRPEGGSQQLCIDTDKTHWTDDSGRYLLPTEAIAFGFIMTPVANNKEMKALLSQ